MMSTKKILIPVLATAGLLTLSAGLEAQVRVAPPKPAEAAKSGREAAAEELLKLSAKMRREGQSEVARVLRDQARRLLRGDVVRGDAQAGDGLRERRRDRSSDEGRGRNRDAVRARADAARARSEQRRAESAKRRAEQAKARQEATKRRTAEAKKRNAEAKQRNTEVKKRLQEARKRSLKAWTDKAPGSDKSPWPDFRVWRDTKTGKLRFLDSKTGKALPEGEVPGFSYRWNKSHGEGKGGLFLTPKAPKAPKPPKAPKVFYLDKDGMDVFVQPPKIDVMDSMRIFIQPPKVDVMVEMDGKNFWTALPKAKAAPEARKVLKAGRVLAAPRAVRALTPPASAANLQKRVKELTSEVAKIRKLLERMHKDADSQERRRLLR